MDAARAQLLPEWDVAQWFNTQQPISLADLRGQVVLIPAFQMLCPGCVMHAIPQARKAHELCGEQGVAMIGLHTVFEHHDAMHPHAWRRSSTNTVYVFRSASMRLQRMANQLRAPWRWGLQGTPTTLVVDRQGRLRLRHFGHVPDLQLGAILGRLLSEA